MFVWAEWTCGKCGEHHRARFDVIVQFGESGGPHQIWRNGRPRTFWLLGDIKIDDIAYNRKYRRPKRHKGGGSKVYAPFNTETLRVIEAIKTYMEQYYSMEKESLSLEVCTA